MRPNPTLSEICQAIPTEGIHSWDFARIFPSRPGKLGEELNLLISQAGHWDKDTGMFKPPGWVLRQREKAAAELAKAAKSS